MTPLSHRRSSLAAGFPIDRHLPPSSVASLKKQHPMSHPGQPTRKATPNQPRDNKSVRRRKPGYEDRLATDLVPLL